MPSLLKICKAEIGLHFMRSSCVISGFRDQFRYAPSQWEMLLQLAGHIPRLISVDCCPCGWLFVNSPQCSCPWHSIRRTCWRGYLDNTFTLHCTNLPHCRAPSRIAGPGGIIFQNIILTTGWLESIYDIFHREVCMCVYFEENFENNCLVIEAWINIISWVTRACVLSWKAA